MPDDSPFKSLDAATLPGEMTRLLCQVAREKGRLEISNCDGGSCIIISREELESLEQALEILYNSEAIKPIRTEVEHFALMAENPPQLHA